jgi:amino acid transporter
MYRYGIVTALYNVIWSYIGYSNANYALSETKNPVRTIKRAAPAALILVSILYMLCNVRILSFPLSIELTLYRSRTLLPSQKQTSLALSKL